VLDALSHQPMALAVQPAGVFLRHARHPHHAHHLGLAPQVRQQRAQQSAHVDPVGLRAPRPPAHLQARGIEHVVLHAVPREQTMQPEAVVTRLVTRHDRHRAAERHFRLAPRGSQQLQQRRSVAGGQRVQADPVAGVSSAISQLFLLNSIATKMPCRITIGRGGRGDHRAVFHQSLLRGWRVWKTETVNTSPAAPA
jgi:hypothetical protein